LAATAEGMRKVLRFPVTPNPGTIHVVPLYHQTWVGTLGDGRVLSTVARLAPRP
jgi:hypothetical protein